MCIDTNVYEVYIFVYGDNKILLPSVVLSCLMVVKLLNGGVLLWCCSLVSHKMGMCMLFLFIKLVSSYCFGIDSIYIWLKSVYVATQDDFEAAMMREIQELLGLGPLCTEEEREVGVCGFGKRSDEKRE